MQTKECIVSTNNDNVISVFTVRDIIESVTKEKMYSRNVFRLSRNATKLKDATIQYQLQCNIGSLTL